MSTREIKQKKEYLESYERAVRKLERSKLRLEEIRRGAVYPPVSNDGMPRALGPSDLSGYVALLDEEEKKYMRCRDECARRCKKIFDGIEKLESEDEKDILVYRYIEFLKWTDIYEKIGYGRTWVDGVHKSALQHLII